MKEQLKIVFVVVMVNLNERTKKKKNRKWRQGDRKKRSERECVVRDER